MVQPKVSVVVPTFCSGAGLDRVIRSLDTQTMPVEEFELVFVDDGSPDDTFDRLRAISAHRPNTLVARIPNSGWPSRPRNIGTDMARGEYVLYMDHDDSLFPDALRAAYDYAHDHHADILSAKECKSNDVWWGMDALADGNIPNALAPAAVGDSGGLASLRPTVPHKLYRRQFLLDHHIRFPEGSRMLWEDVYVNIAAYRHADVVSVMADSPFYLWVASETNSSHTFSPDRVDFWDRLEDLMDFIATTLAAPRLHEARDASLAYQISTRVLGRGAREIAREDGKSSKRALRRARRLLARFATDGVYARLSKTARALAHVIQRRSMPLVRAVHDQGLALDAEVSVSTASWRGGRLHLEIECRWEGTGADAGLRREHGRVVRDASPDLRAAIPPELLDVTDEVETLSTDIGLRARREHVTWQLPLTDATSTFEPGTHGSLALVQHAASDISIDVAALGHPLADVVWDGRMRARWIGLERRAGLRYNGAGRPGLVHGRTALAYANASKLLSIDLAERMRSVVIDGRPRKGPAGPASAFSVPLERLAVFGSETREVTNVVAVPETIAAADDPELLNRLRTECGLRGRIVPEGEHARFEGSANLAPGRYDLAVLRDGGLRRVARSVRILPDGTMEFG